MKKFFLASVACAALSTAASAADLPRKSVAPVVAVPMFTWTGFYLGLNAGYGWADFKRSVSASPVGFGNPAAINAFASRSVSADGFVGGAQVGYNYQIGSFVVGIEADFQFSDLKKSTGPDQVIGVAPPRLISTTSRIEWFGTVRPRIGVAFDRLLVYATGGLAYGSVKTGDTYNWPTGVSTVTASDTRAGYVVGAGLEYAFTSNLTVKAEYLYADFGKKSYVSAPIPGNPNSDVSHSVSTTLNVVRAGINYKF